ncbi:MULTISPECIES: zinc-binding alcohol dehydrogenase family protein [unclassified Pseudomonas]|uniref:zinc-binding alcohol dehydrogenase family protein n=1 Tax=unclassified Pseudomonas TaxID=196821 RepID=UPI000BD3EF2A|nr:MULTISPECIES: zinc-binding alcohol dehydrogenase family protein [unclassified Pseudomonas]PVZ20549.1 NADPH:quinone reductase-like Zn-dependent oxidoreductase [Pseudomonas sp. URIL14HWK12:I12]PVZ27615.1 NADPH:quinone reductase-like Zn-dependent oxidoreductase [Pseudomonas sp. URIL14HWK12:I10]PVZ38504.1 NADPH:quinone reductase-like Zn-dependent oxidoreductase [Pseudomonas sp. URIL14HWK12:I11]SNZ03096.1 NADPH:quinone reductase [Pseudomonas sp. URIL14HWK12:I9]
MQDTVNNALWLAAKQAAFRPGPAPYTAPRGNEVVVRTRAVALNPFDRHLQTIGSLACPWLKYPMVVGHDLAGDVVETGEAVTRFRPGDRVLGLAGGADKQRNRAAEGAFQDYVVLLEHMITPLPAQMSYTQACVLPLGVATAACALFQDRFLALAPPQAQPQRRNETLIVWGGSTSVGANAIQLAVAAGYDVLTTCSPGNFGFVQALGARQAFDYRSATVAADLLGALGQACCVGAVAIGPGAAAACLDLVVAAGGVLTVAVVTPPATFDGIPAGRGRLRKLLPTLAHNATGLLKLAWRAKRRGVAVPFVWGTALIHNEVGPMIFQDYLPEALARGQFIPSPPCQVAGHGLEAIPAAMALHQAGVSATKLVVTL